MDLSKQFNPVPKPISKKPKKNKRKSRPKKGERTKRKDFSKQVKEQAVEYWDGLCANCRSAKPDDPHHIRPRSNFGKGVFTNCLPVCRPCHVEIERNVELRFAWRDWAKETHGHDYWMDDIDKQNVTFYKSLEAYERELCK